MNDLLRRIGAGEDDDEDDDDDEEEEDKDDEDNEFKPTIVIRGLENACHIFNMLSALSFLRRRLSADIVALRGYKRTSRPV